MGHSIGPLGVTLVSLVFVFWPPGHSPSGHSNSNFHLFIYLSICSHFCSTQPITNLMPILHQIPHVSYIFRILRQNPLQWRWPKPSWSISGRSRRSRKSSKYREVLDEYFCTNDPMNHIFLKTWGKIQFNRDIREKKKIKDILQVQRGSWWQFCMYHIFRKS